MPAALYNVFVTGSAGSNVILLYIDDKIVGGIDAGTGKYRGTVQHLPEGGIRGTVSLTINPGQPLITGGVSASNAPAIPIQFDLPPNFDDARTILISTPIGPVNARFEKVMDI